MQTEKFKSIIKNMLGSSVSNPKVNKSFFKIIDEMRENTKKSREYHETFRALVDWMIQQSTTLSDLNYSQKTALMKFVKNTWMPIDEGHFADHINSDGSYQYAVYKKAAGYCSEKKVAIDVGANIGLLARPMSEDFEIVHAFEPQSAARACISRNAPKNNLIIYSYGLGEKNQTIQLNSSSTAVGGAFIKEAAGTIESMKKTEIVNHEQILIRKLDDFTFDRIDLVKIDVQGFEIDVLKGGRNTFKKFKPVLILEAGGKVEKMSGVDPEEALDYAVKEIGYVVRENVNKDFILT